MILTRSSERKSHHRPKDSNLQRKGPWKKWKTKSRFLTLSLKRVELSHRVYTRHNQGLRMISLSIFKRSINRCLNRSSKIEGPLHFLATLSGRILHPWQWHSSQSKISPISRASSNFSKGTWSQLHQKQLRSSSRYPTTNHFWPPSQTNHQCNPLISHLSHKASANRCRSQRS